MYQGIDPKINPTMSLNPVLFADKLDLGLAGSQMDRPLGSAPNNRMRVWMLVFTREQIEARPSSPTSVGGLDPGVIPVQFADQYVPQSGLGGISTAYLRVERIR